MQFLFLILLGFIGIAYGVLILYSIIMRKEWIDTLCKSKGLFPYTVGGPTLNKINLIWTSIVAILLSGGLVFALISNV